MNKVIYSFLLFIFISCGSAKTLDSKSKGKIAEQEKKNTYLALGDSYTIGEAVKPESRWPVLLTEKLNESGYSFNPPVIIAKTAWTTNELLKAAGEHETSKKYDLISILIGVNNQYQNKNIQQFKEELAAIIKQAASLSKEGTKNIFAFSIPDYGVTPFAKDREPEKITSEIKTYNLAYSEICEKLGVKFYDITTYSRLAEKNNALIADDKLHPSREMYRLWVEKHFESIVNDVIR